MKRYNAVQGGVYDNSVMVEEKDGDWVWWEDVEAQRAELLEALKVFLEYNDQGGPLSFNIDAMWAQARAAIAKAEWGKS